MIQRYKKEQYETTYMALISKKFSIFRKILLKINVLISKFHEKVFQKIFLPQKTIS